RLTPSREYTNLRPRRPAMRGAARRDGAPSGELSAIAAKLTREFFERRNPARLRVRAPRLKPREQLLLRPRLPGPPRLEAQLEVVNRLQRRVAAEHRLEIAAVRDVERRLFAQDQRTYPRETHLHIPAERGRLGAQDRAHDAVAVEFQDMEAVRDHGAEHVHVDDR